MKEKPQNNELTATPAPRPPQIYCHSLTEALEMAQVLSHITVAEPETIAAKVLAGQELGLSPSVAVRGIHVLEIKDKNSNRVTTRSVMVSPKVMAGLVRASGKCAALTTGGEYDENDELVCVAYGKRSDTGEELTRRFSMQDGKRAGLLGKDVYVKYPKRMLTNRALGYLCQDLWPEVCMGINIGTEDDAAPIEVEAELVEDEKPVNKPAIGKALPKPEAVDAALNTQETKPKAPVDWDKPIGKKEPPKKEPKAEKPEAKVSTKDLT